MQKRFSNPIIYIHILYVDGTLNIEGKHCDNENKTVSYNTIQRSFSLPSNILSDVSKIKAQYDDGILNVLIPKKNGSPDDNSSNKIIIN